VIKDLVLKRDALLDREEIIDALGLPIVVKPSCEGSSLGVTIASTPEELDKGIFNALACGQWIILEQYLEGREITSAVIGNDEPEALPLIEICPGQGYEFFTYDAKYLPGATNEICPAPLPEDLTLKAQELGRAAHKALYCAGYSRTDMILKDGEYYLLETNTIPGMTRTSLFPQAALAGGMDFSTLMDRLIELALARQ
jgi:D-alanine-D-alanine ligase